MFSEGSKGSVGKKRVKSGQEKREETSTLTVRGFISTFLLKHFWERVSVKLNLRIVSSQFVVKTLGSTWLIKRKFEIPILIYYFVKMMEVV